MLIALRHKQKCQQATKQKNALNSIVDQDMQNPVINQSADDIQHIVDVSTTALHIDLEHLSGLTDITKKIEYKKTVLIGKYKNVIDSYIASGANTQSELFFYYALWLIDCEKIEEGLALIDLFVNQNQPTPERFKREGLSILCDAVWAWCQDCYKRGESAHPYFDTLLAHVESGKWGIHPINAAQIFKLAAQLQEQENNLEKALHYYTLCMQSNPEKHGVKTAHAKVVAALEKR